MSFCCLMMWSSNQIIFKTVSTNQTITTSLFVDTIIFREVTNQSKNSYNCEHQSNRFYILFKDYTDRCWPEIWSKQKSIQDTQQPAMRICYWKEKRTMEKWKGRRRSSVHFCSNFCRSGTAKIPIQEMESSSIDLGWLCCRIVDPK